MQIKYRYYILSFIVAFQLYIENKTHNIVTIYFMYKTIISILYPLIKYFMH